MLPATGFFKNIECPFYENSCDRPYCHFKHRKKKTGQEDTIESSTSFSTSTEVPTYNPTPKSQLANARSHIPITYVPDLTVRSCGRKNFRSSTSLRRYENKPPTYNPTPLSILSKTKTDDAPLSEKEEIEKYTPTNYIQEDCDEINFDNLEMEFNMIDEIISDSGTLDTTLEECESTKDEENLTNVETKQNGMAKESKSSLEGNGNKEKSRHRNNKEEECRKIGKAYKKNRKDKKEDDHLSKSSSKHSSRGKKHRHRLKPKERDKQDDKHSSRKHTKNSKDKMDKNSDKERNKREGLDKLDRKEKETEYLNNDNCDMSDEYDEDDGHISDDSETEIDPMQECYKIFTEYKPTEPDIFAGEIPKQENSQETYIPTSTKKRIAHENADKLKSNLSKKMKIPPRNPAQTMIDRLKAARLTQANDEHKNLTAEIEKLKRTAPDPSVSEYHPPPVKRLKFNNAVKPSTSTVSLIDDIISGKSTTNLKPRKIAPVQNVTSIQREKAKLTEMVRMRTVNAICKTASQTISKGSKRVAHVPEYSIADMPNVLEMERSKLPVNVRTRFLKMIADECLKLYQSKDDAFQRALNEEFKCYERCSVLVTYRNTAMLAINRLRKELQERETSGLGPLAPGETPHLNKNNEGEFRGRKFYENIKQYTLNEEELITHGFPREGTTLGHAVIKLQKKTAKVTLKKDDRICCRCSKHYKVDKKGFALFQQECLYHPLKKRTFRGESIYLCCKSSEDTGCVTSTTHVSERINSDNEEVEGYQVTMPSESKNDPRSYEVYALDCEMCYTIKGLELTRVTIVNSECKTVYETLVKPLNPIIDYNTRFSGITPEQMERTATSILQVQANILHLCNSDSILIGHSLESDMKALKIIHSNIIDTSVLFPHKFGLPHKRALRDLAREYLKKIIQNDISGHDSAEDALTCMELVQWKLREEFKARGIKV